MDYKRNIKYFTSNISKVFLFISIGLLAASVVCIFILWGYYYIGMALFIPGVFLAFLSSVLNVKDAELDGCGKRIADAFKASVATKIPALNASGKSKNFVPKEPIFYEEYFYDGDIILIKKGKDARYRTAAYYICCLVIDTDRIYTAVKTVSLVEDKSSEQLQELMLGELSGVAMEEISNENYRIIAKYKILKFIGGDGKVVASIPVSSDAEAEKTADRINTLIRKAKTA